MAAVLVVGGAVATGFSVTAKSELCDMVGHTAKLGAQGNGDATVMETAAERIHTLSSRLILSGDLKDASVGLADALDSMAILYQSGFEDADDRDAEAEAHIKAVAISALTNMSKAQRACGLPVTGTNTPA